MKVFKEQELPTEKPDEEYPEWLMEVGKPQLSLFQLKKRNYEDLTERRRCVCCG
jgi:hypothetical protein